MHSKNLLLAAQLLLLLIGTGVFAADTDEKFWVSSCSLLACLPACLPSPDRKLVLLLGQQVSGLKIQKAGYEMSCSADHACWHSFVLCRLRWTGWCAVYSLEIN
eukprot:1138512-Pelagomonas_calceolata.AAC.6